MVTSRGDSDAYNKRAVVNDDKLKSVKKEKVEEKKKVSQVNVKNLVAGFKLRVFVFTGVRQTE